LRIVDGRARLVRYWLCSYKKKDNYCLIYRFCLNMIQIGNGPIAYMHKATRILHNYFFAITGVMPHP
jgi:hypothetical protein